ncbi:DUF1254 domain-containing protein [Leclercia pneumoniae]|uniref:DUF1254 domain-containing protein n=1 Tax=Leclercia pneumoniae TaxID=2815358 RepID=UPI003BF5251D
MKHCFRFTAGCALIASVLFSQGVYADRYDDMANLPMEKNRPTVSTTETLLQELTFQRAMQSYLWAMPLLNTAGMRDGAEAMFGTGYNIMPVWGKRLDPRTKITTPNSDLIYGMVFENLAKTGPLVFEAPPGLQGIILDFWQRPMPVDGMEFQGDIGLPGPDGGKGGKFLILPPDYKGEIPEGYYVYRSTTNNVFIFLRAFYKDPKDTSPAVNLLKQSVFYPLGQKEGAKKMEFPDASEKDINMLPRSDFSAFKQLKRIVDEEGTHLAGPDMLGMLASIGIMQNKDFTPSDADQKLLENAAKAAYKTSRAIGFKDNLNGVDLHVFKDRKWLNPVNNVTTRWPNQPADLTWRAKEGGFLDIDARTWFFTDYYSISPGMVSMTPGKGAYYMIAFDDKAGKHLDGDKTYHLHLPANIPARLFWSVTLYEAENASGLATSQPFPSLGKLDNPVQNADGSTDLYIGPKAPEGKEKNWLATAPGRGFFSILRLYVPEEAALDGSWKPGDFEEMN